MGRAPTYLSGAGGHHQLVRHSPRRVCLRQSSECGVGHGHNTRGKDGKDQRSLGFAQTFARRQIPLNQAS
jgi:hypothetical protein